MSQLVPIICHFVKNHGRLQQSSIDVLQVCELSSYCGVNGRTIEMDLLFFVKVFIAFLYVVLFALRLHNNLQPDEVDAVLK